MGNNLVTNPMTVDTAATLWSNAPRRVRLIQWIDDAALGVLAYDVSIKNIEERKKKVLVFKTLKLAEQKLGVGQHLLKNAMKRRGRVFSELYQKEFAVRIKPGK